ncbi:MAG TPA: protein kinase [Polyangiaceae bacterium]|nr:protein kinase [Polyangiaceae bacterium]
MTAHARVGDRFELLARVGAGGMGEVYRAKDLQTGGLVALKRMLLEGGADRDRFAREAELLASLDHPAIVRWVAHGLDERGVPFLAMDWLPGLDLAERLARGPMSTAESLALSGRVAAALGHAHAHGVVHRDIKPSNIFLVGGDPARAVVVDFGIAKITHARRALTAPSARVGTVGYMSPEQARGEAHIGPPADVFALGCVLYECLTGAPTFEHGDPFVVLARVLLETPPRVRQRSPALPEALDDLVARMLAQDPRERPRDGAEVHRALEALGPAFEHLGTAPTEVGDAAPTPASRAEQRITALLLIARAAHTEDAALAKTEADGEDGRALGEIAEVARRHGCELVPLALGPLLVLGPSEGPAIDRAARAAACALALTAFRPGLRVALATGLTRSGAGAPLGPAIDRAAELLRADVSAAVRVDEASAGLLEGTFLLGREGDARVLLGRRGEVGAGRELLGRPMPYVGREKELGLLEATFRECATDGVARATLVTAPAGMGKSRLGHELVARLARVGPLRVLRARGEALARGSPMLLGRQWLRHGLEVGEGCTHGVLRERVRALLGDHARDARTETWADVLGDAVGLPTDAPGEVLNSARNDPQLHAEWSTLAFVRWLSAEAERAPVLLVAEDVHWGDAGSVRWLRRALRDAAELPWMVLALGRPESVDVFPDLAAFSALSLSPLTRRACERLARAVLGEGLDGATLDAIVAGCEGNGFFLEELIRAAASGGLSSVPESVLAMVQARLDGLGPDERRVLRAGSVLGERFWAGAVVSLLGHAGASEVEGALARLSAAELVERVAAPEALRPGEHRFRHALLSDAAYAMIPEADRPGAHRLAARWLEDAGERSPLVLAEHCERGEDPAGARRWLSAAVDQVLSAGELGVDARVDERALASGLEGEPRGTALLLRGLRRGLGEDAPLEGVVALREAVGLLPKGGVMWASALGSLAYQSLVNASPAAVREAARELATIEPLPPPIGTLGNGIMSCVLALGHLGAPDLVRALTARYGPLASRGDAGPQFRAYERLWASLVAYQLEQSPGVSYTRAMEATRLFEPLRDTTGLFFATMFSLWPLVELPDAPMLERVALATPLVRRGAGAAGLHALDVCVAQWRLSRGELDACEALATHVATSSSALIATRGTCLLATVQLERGELDRAEATLETLRGPAEVLNTLRSRVLVVDARVALARGHAEACLDALAEAEISLRSSGLADTRDALTLARCEALLALDDHDALRVTLLAARARAARVEQDFGEPELRAAWRRGRHVAPVLALAARWLE